MQIIDLIYVIFFSLIMAAIGYIDYKKNIIPNIIVFPAMVVAIIFSFFTSLGWQSCLLGGAIGIGYCLIFWAISYILHQSISYGDYRLFILIGFITGYPVSFLLIGIAFFITGFYKIMKDMYINGINLFTEKRKQISVEAGPPFALITIGWLISWLLMYLPATT